MTMAGDRALMLLLMIIVIVTTNMVHAQTTTNKQETTDTQQKETVVNKEQTTTATTNTSSSSSNSEGKDTEDGTIGEGGKFFLKSYSTRTWTFLSSFTSTVPYTCYTTGGAAPDICMGRRLRRVRKIQMGMDSSPDLTLLESSVPDGSDTFDQQDKSAEEKFFFRLYRTISTTATITTFSTNRSVTVSASIMCTYAGINYNVC